MTAARHPEQDFTLRIVKHRRADCDIGEMRAPIVGSINRIDVAGPNAAFVLANDRFNGAIHGAEMHRHVRRIGDQRAFAVKDRTGEIQALLDVDRIGGVLQRDPHLFSNRHEQIVEHFEHHRGRPWCQPLAGAREF